MSEEISKAELIMAVAMTLSQQLDLTSKCLI